MKILLLGEYSNVHHTLAQGFKALGHDAVVASDGDLWKKYPRDIDLWRAPGKWGGIRFLFKLLQKRHLLQDFDVVQFINPLALPLKAERNRYVYEWIRRHNKKVFLGAFGMDYYWVRENITRKPLRYSDFNMGDILRTNPEALIERKDWIGTPKEALNKQVALDCDGIIAGLYEYWACYEPVFPEKTTFIPFPIVPKTESFKPYRAGDPVHIFVGISKGRSAYKGTDIMLAAAQAVQQKHPDRLKLTVTEGLPFAEYIQRMNEADAIIDQLYSYTPAMNALEAMSRGIICIGGGEPENYEILGETDLRPIINVLPHYEDVYRQIEQLILHPEQINTLKAQSMEYIQKHHNYIDVAQRYLSFYHTMPDK